MASLWEERELRKRSRDEGEEEITAGERGLLMELASEVGGGWNRVTNYPGLPGTVSVL